MDDLTREIFGNIGPLSKALFYLCALASLAACAWGIWRRARLWRSGRPAGEKIDWGLSLRRLGEALSQRAVRRTRRRAGLVHTLLFFGFAALFVGTCLIAVEEWGKALLGGDGGNLFHKGLYFVLYEVSLEVAGLLFLAGCGWFLVRLLRGGGGDAVAYRRGDLLLLITLILIGVSGYLLEGLRILREATPHPGLSFVGYACSRALAAIGLGAESAARPHLAVWWLHSLMVFGLIAALPHTRLLHAIAGPLHLCLTRRQLGHMTPISLQELEERGKTGVEHALEFTRHQLLGLDACVACGRCHDACPAAEAGKPLSPLAIVEDIRASLAAPGGEDGRPPLQGGVIAAEALWSCTTCNACHAVCPLGVSPVGMITDMRRFLVGDGALSGPPATALQKVQRSGNPWGRPAGERPGWAEGLEVPTVADNPDFEVLYWIGCAAAYDPRVGKVARAVVRLLQIAGTNYATLGPEERCSGEFARRLGDEFLFQEQAHTNIETLDRHGAKTIITHCPHCLQSLGHDYPQFGGQYEVLHHSVFLSRLLASGALPAPARGAAQGAQAGGAVTYHDPCYLSRTHGVEDEPRALLEAAVGAGKLVEMPRNRCAASCCGAGGGRMWFDDGPAGRIGRSRVAESLATGAETVAVSCPFCMTMMGDGIKGAGGGAEVKDVAELLADAIGGSGP